MTLEQFLAWEDRQELRYEFDGVRPIAMNGGTVAHSIVQCNLLAALGTRLRGQACRPHGNTLKVQVAGSIRYPDAFVVCTPLHLEATVVAEPVVVFEVLGGDTLCADVVTKNIEYRDTPSVRRYVILPQDVPGALAFFHRSGNWVADPVAGRDAVLHLPEIGIELPLGEIYDGIAPAEDDATNV